MIKLNLKTLIKKYIISIINKLTKSTYKFVIN